MELAKEYFDSQLEKLNTRMDGFATKDDLLELATKQDLNSLKRDVTEIKAMVQRIDKRDKEDSDAFAKDIVKLQKDVKQLKLNCAASDFSPAK